MVGVYLKLSGMLANQNIEEIVIKNQEIKGNESRPEKTRPPAAIRASTSWTIHLRAFADAQTSAVRYRQNSIESRWMVNEAESLKALRFDLESFHFATAILRIVSKCIDSFPFVNAFGRI